MVFTMWSFTLLLYKRGCLSIWESKREKTKSEKGRKERAWRGIFVCNYSAHFEVPRSTTKRPPIGTIFWYVVHLIIGFILYGWIVVLSLQSHIPFVRVLSWVLLISTNWVMIVGDLAKLVDAWWCCMPLALSREDCTHLLLLIVEVSVSRGFFPVLGFST